MAVSGSNSQYSGALDHANAKAAAELAKVSKEKNPYGVAEATLAYTWDWNSKQPVEGLEWVRGGAMFAPAAPAATSTPAVASVSTPGGSGLAPSSIGAPRIVPKISVNFPGKRSSTLSSITSSTGAPGNSALIARLPGLAERSLSHSHVPPLATANATTSMEGSMLPPPVPALQQVVPPKMDELIPSKEEARMREEDDKEDVMMMMESVLGPDLTVDTPVEDMELDSAISQLVGEGPDTLNPGAITGISSQEPFSSSAELDGEIDKEIADVLGEDDEVDDADGDVDADIAEALGSEASATDSRPLVSIASVVPPSVTDEEPQLDMELAELLEEPPEQSAEYYSTPFQPSADVDRKPSINTTSTAFETLGVGEPPTAPGEGSTVLLSEMDYLLASSSGTLAFASSTTLPLATSALRSTTTPYNGTPGYGSPAPVMGAVDSTVQGMKHEEVTPALDSLPQRTAPTEYS